MIPSDCPAVIDKIPKEISKTLKTCAIDAQEFLYDIGAKEPYVTIFLLDCCRKYVLRNEYLDTNIRTRGEERNDVNRDGLAAMHNAGSIIAFACAPGAAVDDNSHLFAQHLVKHITTPKKRIFSILTDVTKGVVDESKSNQMPFVTFQLLTDEIYLYEQIPGKNVTDK